MLEFIKSLNVQYNIYIFFGGVVLFKQINLKIATFQEMMAISTVKYQY